MAKKVVLPSNRGQVVQFIRPMENNGISVDLIKIEVDAIFQLLLGSNTNPSQHLLCHFTKETFNQVQPGTMCRRENKCEPPFCFCGEIRHNFFGFVGGVIVADNSDNVTLGIHGIEFFQ